MLTAALLAAGCLPAAPPTPTSQAVATTVSSGTEPATPTPEIFLEVPAEARAQSAAHDALAAHLGVDRSAITVRKVVETEWPDSCLGLTQPGQACQIGSVAGYRVVLDVGEAAYEVRTDARAETVLVAGRVDPTLGELPAVCQGVGLATFYSPENGFCFAYPAGFTLGESNPARSEIYGPALDASAEALRAAMQLEIRPITTGETLPDLVDAYLAEFQGLPVPEIERSAMTVGGEPAERLEVVPGREGSRDVFLLRSATLYHFLFMPSVRDYPQAAEAVENLFLTVTSSFSFLPEAAD
jgi:hypothetical protein